ncbi:glycoside hydrolase family 36 protein [uncultured Dokdonia sp.]|uniref:glycoside hydrolase family 36 protein n=1 Tax=uncultured Dokdonia sp. TaxID=575653 RepID=UPI0026284129|nr:glycoside hydrolase family 36 protein [uncultured Dokdonia sp.]
MEEVITHRFNIIKDPDTFDVTITSNTKEKDIDIYTIYFSAHKEFTPKPVTISWKIPAINVKGVWKPTSDFSKRIMDDWELNHMESRISVDAPVVSIYGHNDKNTLTFACADAINTTSLNALYREEDNCIYCHITLFAEAHHSITSYSTELRIDQNTYHFSEALKGVRTWWENFEHLTPTPTPALAKKPVYSTWYQFHQNLEPELLIEECKLASKLGYELMILDDGWQTKDSNRGYDYTGDWEPERIPNLASFTEAVHATGMKLALWYSVPFCGKHSKAYQKFKGKFLTENHRWAPVFDPRYPEVRTYLIGLYTKALEEWNLDGFKLDFIDEFKAYPETVLTLEDGRDFSSINEAVDRLLTDVITSLKAIKKDVVIEFRQKYTGPAMRKYGNMFRAFDCPGDNAMNRVRIADIKMISGDTAVHSDMFTYHKDEPIEIKALQLVNTLFGVPQLSILLQEVSQEEASMIGFYTKYWNQNATTLLKGDFTPHKPLANYPICESILNDQHIIGVFDNYVVPITSKAPKIDIINGQLEEYVIINCNHNLGDYNMVIYSCTGKIIQESSIQLQKGILKIEVPQSGLIKLSKNTYL